TKRVTVRGNDASGVATRVTLAHELTHVLQDQHFGLERITRAAEQHHGETVASAVLEGDAIRVQNLYEQQQSAADQAPYAAASMQQTADAQAAVAGAQIPDVLVAIFQAPYDFGPSLVTAVEAAVRGGVDSLFRRPPTTDSAFLTPANVVKGASFVTVAAP